MEHSQIFSNVYIAFRVDQIYLIVANARKLLSKTRKHTEQPPFWKLANTLSSHHFENLQTHKAATFWKLANTQSSHFLKTRKHTEQPLFENLQTHKAATFWKLANTPSSHFWQNARKPAEVWKPCCCPDNSRWTGVVMCAGCSRPLNVGIICSQSI